MKRRLFLLLGTLFSLSLVVSLLLWMPSGAHASTSYDINTLAGKVASVNGTVGLQTRMSAFLQQEADAGEVGATGRRRLFGHLLFERWWQDLVLCISARRYKPGHLDPRRHTPVRWHLRCRRGARAGLR